MPGMRSIPYAHGFDPLGFRLGISLQSRRFTDFPDHALLLGPFRY